MLMKTGCDGITSEAVFLNKRNGVISRSGLVWFGEGFWFESNLHRMGCGVGLSGRFGSTHLSVKW